LQEAEGVFRQCLILDPGFWDAGKDLARLLMERSRQEEADRLLSGFFEYLRGDPEEWMAKWNLNYAAKEVGRIYQDRHLPEQAKQYYLRAYGIGEYDQYLADDLAAVLEALGEYKEAVAVLKELKAWLTGREYQEFYLKRTEESLTRITEKLRSQQPSQGKPDSQVKEPGKPPSFR
jgi:tetratricopeptide (TPR) repeat protein